MVFKFLKLVDSKELSLFWLAVLLFLIKTYFVYLIEFNLDVGGRFQQFLLFINPISSAILLLGGFFIL